MLKKDLQKLKISLLHSLGLRLKKNMGKTSAHFAAENKLVSLSTKSKAGANRILCGRFARLVLLPYFSKVDFAKV
jgi:hypothetical protein